MAENNGKHHRGLGAKLNFFDNVYMYGKVSGAMTEETPFNPCSKKGEVHVRIANSLIKERKAGSLSAMIARAALDDRSHFQISNSQCV